MQKSVLAIAISSTLVLGILSLGCGQPAPVAFQVSTAPPPTPKAMPEELLEGMRLSTMWSIEEQVTRGQSNPDYLYVSLSEIEEAQRTLRQLEVQRQATLTVVDAYIVDGQAVPEFLHEVLESIEEARHDVLVRTGLAE